MERKDLLLGGIALVIVILAVGVMVPSGFVFMNIPKMAYSCVNLNTYERCDGQTDFWNLNHWTSYEGCSNARDEYKRPCITYTTCACKQMK